MKYRELGSTGILVSEIGFGGWGIGGVTKGATSYGPTDDIESERALEKAFDLGVNFFDTAEIYGHSEELIGKTFSNRRSQVIIATKVGFLEHHIQDFSKTNLINSLHRSLRNLQTDYVDLYQLHNPFKELALEEITETLDELKTRGLIRFYGISVKSPDDGFDVMNRGVFSSLQININMADHRAIDKGLLNLARKKNIGVIGRTPLCFGFLTGKKDNLNFNSSDHRSTWPREQLKSWQRAAKLFAEINPYPNGTLTQMALRFCLDSNGIGTVIPGMLRVSDVLENISAVDLPPLSGETLRLIQNIYRENNGFFIQKPG